MRSVIFDLDGTLADTSGDLIAAANACFRGLGHGDMLDPVDDAATAFRGGRAMLRLGFGRLGLEEDALSEQVEGQFNDLLAHYEAAIDVHTVLYPGAMDAVERLRGQGVRVGICTNKPEGLAEILLRNLGVREAFGALIGADTLPVRKPDAAPLAETVSRMGGKLERSLIVGDTSTDRLAARAAGIPCILVTFGPDGRAVAALEPEALLDHFDHLPDLVAEMLP
ncbi:HAD-IA family hydrolase [Aliiruegeria sabulilitoris]|uniref:HAD-IA family hydrolase n=1 Tax=Aliiruegeria sabulilitoris TaxID=1510458 RepID=UPI00083228DC|nr:HAD-IA family hydrolase [Aliiruegeria sabulilitoris]NDR55790.1 HAD-IA family hydrolase [Pseudoruegeria sp. M32A2M]